MHELKNTLTEILDDPAIPESVKNRIAKVFQRQQKRIDGLEFMNARMLKDKEITVNMLRSTIEELNDKNILIQEQLGTLERSYEELEQFTYIASHDLKSPLRSICNFSQLIQKRYKSELDESANEYLDFVVQGAKRMELIISDLLSFAIVGKKDSEFKFHQLGDIFDHVLLNLFNEIQQNEAIIEIPEKLPLLYLNESSFIQLFQNLISNAIKFRREEVTPHIKITYQQTDKHCLFQVIDNGVGLDMEFAHKAFRPFQRINNIDRPGTGIGLAICKKAVELHKGEISVDSAKNIGTTFFIRFPLSFVKK